MQICPLQGAGEILGDILEAMNQTVPHVSQIELSLTAATVIAAPLGSINVEILHIFKDLFNKNRYEIHLF